MRSPLFAKLRGARMWSSAAVFLIFIVFRFCALRGQNERRLRNATAITTGEPCLKAQLYRSIHYGRAVGVTIRAGIAAPASTHSTGAQPITSASPEPTQRTRYQFPEA